MADLKLLRKGKAQGRDKADLVRDWQSFLAKQGYSVAVDGRFGPETKAAVQAFQKRNGIAVDGVIGPETWRVRQKIETTPLPRDKPGLNMVEEGNIDLSRRPRVQNPDGSISTERSMSFGEDGKEVLIPTIAPSGAVLSPEGAISLYRRTGQHLGKFADVESANRYAQSLHERQGRAYAPEPIASAPLIPVKRSSVRDLTPPPIPAVINKGAEPVRTPPALITVDTKEPDAFSDSFDEETRDPITVLGDVLMNFLGDNEARMRLAMDQKVKRVGRGEDLSTANSPLAGSQSYATDSGPDFSRADPQAPTALGDALMRAIAKRSLAAQLKPSDGSQ